MDRPVTILIGALGGEGGGVLAQWLVEAATQSGYPAQSTSIPGVAQRTGATTYYVEVFPRLRAELGGREPVLSLLPVPGGIDLVVASELLEAARIAGAGMVSPDRTLLVTSTGRTLTTAEKMAQGDGRFDAELLQDVVRRHSARCVAFDMDAAARDAGTVVSAVMFGAVAGSGVLPVAREPCEAVIRADDRGAEASLRGFAAGFAAVQGAAAAPLPAAPPAAAPAADAFGAFPAQVRDIVALGHARLAEFQDAAYAAEYVARVTRVLAAERRADPAAAHGFALARETARFLALWMAFDDVVRVAGQKCRASRFARVRREVAANDGDVVRIVDVFKPGVPEFAGLLPPSWSARLVAWDRRRQLRGEPPLAFALNVRTDTVAGFLSLRLLASLTGLRRRGARYALEQAAIERWLVAVERAADADWARAHELALCGRLIKGYGATNERAKQNLSHILAHLATAPAAAIRQAREAALADEGGRALDQALVAHGVPARPVVAQPIRWTRKRPDERAPTTKAG
ncbi:MAG: indolepyruvate oxidoreductase subunit beta family protein [Burkholderiales bacterium]